jgi:hypothetical protein
VAPNRWELRVVEVVTIRFETAPNEQLQIDFGEITLPVAGERVKAHLFVATLGYSRRPYVAVLEHERTSGLARRYRGYLPLFWWPAAVLLAAIGMSCRRRVRHTGVAPKAKMSVV